MLPRHLALIDDDPDYCTHLSRHLQKQGVRVDVFGDSNDLLTDADAYAYDFYVVDLSLPGVDGTDLIKVLRRRSDVGLLVVTGRNARDAFSEVMNAGADMYLVKPVPVEQVALAISAVQRRVAPNNPAEATWRLDRRSSQLLAPDGARVDLSANDVLIIECFVEANGAVVTREVLQERLGLAPVQDPAGGLNATIYRLRRRIERATPSAVPLQTKSRVGYVFRAHLKVQ